MTVSTIGSKGSSQGSLTILEDIEIEKRKMAEKNASPFHQDTISSALPPTIVMQTSDVPKLEDLPSDPSYYQRLANWLTSFRKRPPIQDNTQNNGTWQISTPTIEAFNVDKTTLDKSFIHLNQERSLIDATLTARKHNQEAIALKNEDIRRALERNRNLKETYAALNEGVETRDKYVTMLEWATTGITAGTILLMGGAWLLGAPPGAELLFGGASGISAGLTAAVKSYLKKKIDEMKGDIFLAGHEKGNNHRKALNSLEFCSNVDQENYRLLESLLRVTKRAHETTRDVTH